MSDNFGDLKQDIVSRLDSVYEVIFDLLNKGDNSLNKIKKKLTDSMTNSETNPNIYKNEESFVNVISCVTDSLKNINSIIGSVRTVGEAGCPITVDVKKALFATAEYIDLISIKLWKKFRNVNDLAILVDVYGNEYRKGDSALFYVEQCFSPDDMEPLYRENFNIKPYRDDNKTVYLYLNKGLIVKNESDDIVNNFSIKNLRTIISVTKNENGVEKIVDEEKPGMIYVYKNKNNVMSARLLFDVCFPSYDDESIGYPKDYFYITAEVDYNLETSEYSLRVIDNI